MVKYISYLSLLVFHRAVDIALVEYHNVPDTTFKDPNIILSRVIRQRLHDSGPEWDLKVSGPEWDPNLLRPEWLKLSFIATYNPRLKILIKYKVTCFILVLNYVVT